MSVNKRQKKPSQEKKPLSHGWIVVPSKTYPDRVYFYNTVTKCSTWNNPCEVHFDKSAPEKNKSKQKPQAKETINGSLLSCNNSDIEDYDEQQDQYFDNIPFSKFSLSHSDSVSPPSSPESVHSFKTNVSDSEALSMPLKNNKKELWLQFASPSAKQVKESIALSDFNRPSTSRKASETILKKPLELKWKKTQHIEDCKGSNKSGARQTEKQLLEAKGRREILNRVACKKQGNTPAQKRLLKLRESLVKNATQKTTSNDPSKRHDKAPAQSRLLKLRRQNSEVVKDYEAKHKHKYSSLINECDINCKGENKNLGSLPGRYNLADAHLNLSHDQEFQDTGSSSKDDFYEEMDWEPSSDELDVKNINVFRLQQEINVQLPQGVFSGLNSDSSPALTYNSYSWVLVIDTNIIVSCLNFIRELRDTKIAGFNYPIVYIPWRVLQELDHLKDSKMSVSKKLQLNVRKAITYLNDNFKMKHPRCFGQSFEEYVKMFGKDSYAPDDEILQTCIQLQRLYPEKKLTLLTNDKNLESKALVSGVETYSKERFQKKYFTQETPSRSFDNDRNLPYQALQVDNVLCEVKMALKNFIVFVVETELKIAFERDWIKLSFKKPPWTLQDALACFLKHWRSVFFLVFSKNTLDDVEKLYKLLFKQEAVTIEEVREIIFTIQDFIADIKTSKMTERSYSDLVDLTMSNLNDSLKNLSPQDDGEASQFPRSQHQFHSRETSQDEMNRNDVEKVKALFRNVWEVFRSFCCSVSDMLNSSAFNNNCNASQEIRLKLSETLKQVGEMISGVNQILEIEPQEISERHPLICHFSSFLAQMCPVLVTDLGSRLPACLSAFFKDLAGRSLLSASLNDFREFSQDLQKAAAYFNAQSQV